jgi:hypothetical protein
MMRKRGFTNQLAWVLAMLAMGPLTVRAESSPINSLAAEQRAMDEELRELDKRVKDLQKEKRALESPSSAETEFGNQAYNCHDTCVQPCARDLARRRPPILPAVKDEDFNDPKFDTQVCRTLFDQSGSNVEPGCLTAMQKCGYVDRQVKLKRVSRDLESALAQHKEKREERRDLANKLAEAQRACPQCAMIEAMKPREPGTGDYIVGALQALTPALVGGLGYLSYSKGLKQYYGAYGNYIDSCMEFVIQ